jgi:hypothetical protein
MSQFFQKQLQILRAAPFFRPLQGTMPALAAIILLSGCAHRYDVTLTNNMRLTNVSKPILDRSAGVYVYKDVNGQERRIMASRVVEIDAHSHRNPSAPFGQ